jgi:hypothetical protein
LEWRKRPEGVFVSLRLSLGTIIARGRSTKVLLDTGWLAHSTQCSLRNEHRIEKPLRDQFKSTMCGAGSLAVLEPDHGCEACKLLRRLHVLETPTGGCKKLWRDVGAHSSRVVFGGAIRLQSPTSFQSMSPTLTFTGAILMRSMRLLFNILFSSCCTANSSSPWTLALDLHSVLFVLSPLSAPLALEHAGK